MWVRAGRGGHAAGSGAGTRGYPEGVTATASPARWLRAAVLATSSVGLAVSGHLIGGGHADPAFLMLLVAAAMVGGHHWLRRERGPLAILAAVVLVQVAAHLVLSTGHDHRTGSAMLLGHAVAALALAAFLRMGEARLHAAARGRYARWLVALRLAMAGPGSRPGFPRLTEWTPLALAAVWTSWVPAGRGPPGQLCH